MKENELNVWKDLCTKSIENDSEATEFIQFILTEKQKRDDLYVWTTTRQDFQTWCHQIGFDQHGPTFSLSEDALKLLFEEKDKVRSYWHFHRRTRAQQAIAQCIQQTEPISISPGQRLVLFRQFVSHYRRHPSAQPFFRGLRHLLTSQMGKATLMVWRMPEYIWVDGDPKEAQAQVQLLIETLGFEVTYHGSKPEVSIPITSDYNTLMSQHGLEETCFEVRVSAVTTDGFLKDVVKSIPKQSTVSLEERSCYRLTDLPRTAIVVGTSRWALFKQWIIQSFYQVISIFKKIARLFI